MVFGKLNRLRAEHERALQKLAEAQKKVDETAEKVKAGEATEVLNIVAEKKLSPEQLYELLSGKDSADVAIQMAEDAKNNTSKNIDKEIEEDFLDEDI